MRPKPPRSLSGRHHSDEWYIAVLLAVLAAVWEVGWLVLSLAGADPVGQLPSAFGRVTGTIRLATSSHRFSGSWVHVLWDPARPISLVAVVLVVIGLVLVSAIAVRNAGRLLEHSGRRLGITRPRSGSSTTGKRQDQAGPTVDRSLDEWLAAVAAGEEE
ncbi:MAG TPA: hypothetical protein VMV12_08360 [Candidatus Micrarchaeaceae archaeon]|nr:hypothetical protein [Candidatus Micrarchaeaceae archaeon]